MQQRADAQSIPLSGSADLGELGNRTVDSVCRNFVNRRHTSRSCICEFLGSELRVGSPHYFFPIPVELLLCPIRRAPTILYVLDMARAAKQSC